MFVPLALFIYLASFIPAVAGGKTYIHTIKWIDSAGINFTTYLDGLSMIFGLLITGVGSLVILYSIYYLSEREALGHFYVYLIDVHGLDARGYLFGQHNGAICFLGIDEYFIVSVNRILVPPKKVQIRCTKINAHYSVWRRSDACWVSSCCIQ